MSCDMCGAKVPTVDVLNAYRTEKVKYVCKDCAHDLDSLKAKCKKLSDEATKKIDRRARGVESRNRSENVFWSLISASTVAIKDTIKQVRGE